MEPRLNPLDYAVWEALQQLVYLQKIQDIKHLKGVLRGCWDMISRETWLTVQSTSGQNVLQWLCRHKAVTLSMDWSGIVSDLLFLDLDMNWTVGNNILLV